MRAALVALVAAGTLAGCARPTTPQAPQGPAGGPAGGAVPTASASASTTAKAPPSTATSATGTPSAGAGGPSMAGRAGTRCHTAELTGALRPEEAAAGNRYSILVLTNTSRRTCTLYGYGGIQLAGPDRRPVPTVQRRDPAHPPSLVRLAPGGSASTLLHWTAIAGPDEPVIGPCEPTPTMLLVIPPDETTQLVVPWRFGPACGHGAIDQWAYAQGVIRP